MRDWLHETGIPFSMNDEKVTISFGTKKLLIIVIALQIAVIGLLGLDKLGFEILILRQAITFVYLTFVPGILLLRILKIRDINIVEILLYSVGLSLAFLMLTGLLLNTIAPLFGIANPISEIPLIVTFCIFIFLLCIICFLRDRNYSRLISVDIRQVFSPSVLALLLIPFLAVFGAYLAYYRDENILLLFLLAILATIPVSVFVFNKPSKKLYPLIIFVIALSALYHTTLTSPYFLTADQHLEYLITHLVEVNSYWEPSIPFNHNAMLSLVMLTPIFSILCSISILWVFKLIYPFFLSLVPFGLYLVFEKQTGSKIALLSSFFFISMRNFFIRGSVDLERQIIAMFFLALVILLLIDKRMSKMGKRALVIIFCFSLIVGHYGFSYIFMLSLVLVCGLLFLMQPRFQKSTSSSLVTSSFVSLFILLAITWYMYVSSGTAFDTIVNLGDHVISSIRSTLFQPVGGGTLDVMTMQMPTLSYEILKILHFITQFFILVGFLAVVYDKLKRKKVEQEDFQDDYMLFSLISLAMLAASIAVPQFAGIGSIGVGRLYSFTLFFLAPFCVIGGMISIKILERFTKLASSNMPLKKPNSLVLLSVFFAIFLLFNSGWVTEVTKEHIGSVAISQSRIEQNGSIQEKMSLYNSYIPAQDVFSAKWLSESRERAKKVYSDYYACRLLTVYGKLVDIDEKGLHKHYDILRPDSEIDKESYIYLRKLNNVDGVMTKHVMERPYSWNTSKILPYLENQNKIYSNGGSVIYE